LRHFSCVSNVSWVTGLNLSLAANGGVRTGEDAIKAMIAGAGIVMGYHGCPVDRPEALHFVRGLIAGTHRIEDWRPSSNEYDWLGGGVYFWEYGPKRARQWAGEDGEVIDALIQLGNCFDLTDPGCEALLRVTYKKVAASYENTETTLPTNEAAGGFSRKLDRLIVDEAMTLVDSAAIASQRPDAVFQTVRSAFEEGDAAFLLARGCEHTRTFR